MKKSEIECQSANHFHPLEHTDQISVAYLAKLTSLLRSFTQYRIVFYFLTGRTIWRLDYAVRMAGDNTKAIVNITFVDMTTARRRQRPTFCRQQRDANDQENLRDRRNSASPCCIRPIEVTLDVNCCSDIQLPKVGSSQFNRRKQTVNYCDLRTMRLHDVSLDRAWRAVPRSVLDVNAARQLVQ